MRYGSCYPSASVRDALQNLEREQRNKFAVPFVHFCYLNYLNPPFL